MNKEILENVHLWLSRYNEVYGIKDVPGGNTKELLKTMQRELLELTSDKTKPMTKTAWKHHIATGGQDCCPFCQSEYVDDISCYEIVTLEDGGLEQKSHCYNCGRAWIDIFTLTDVRDCWKD
jgi:hypothetical protein